MQIDIAFHAELVMTLLSSIEREPKAKESKHMEKRERERERLLHVISLG